MSKASYPTIHFAMSDLTIRRMTLLNCIKFANLLGFRLPICEIFSQAHKLEKIPRIAGKLSK